MSAEMEHHHCNQEQSAAEATHSLASNILHECYLICYLCLEEQANICRLSTRFCFQKVVSLPRDHTFQEASHRYLMIFATSCCPGPKVRPAKPPEVASTALYQSEDCRGPSNRAS